MLPRGYTYDIGKVIIRKIDADGNSIVSINNNPILDTLEYRVDFDDVDISKLTEMLLQSPCMMFLIILEISI